MVNRGERRWHYFYLPFALRAAPASLSSSHFPIVLAPELPLFPLATTAMAPKRKVAAADAPATDAATLKGKKTVAGASAPVVDLKKSDGNWVKSTLKEAHLDKLREEGMLPPADQLFVRAPSPKEVLPEPRANERVCFAEFLPRGFSLPFHDFVRGLMYAYGVQIHDFTPNGIMHIACFMVLCECFLGVSPS